MCVNRNQEGICKSRRCILLLSLSLSLSLLLLWQYGAPGCQMLKKNTSAGRQGVASFICLCKCHSISLKFKTLRWMKLEMFFISFKIVSNY